jgi:hypothetical protein
MYTLTSVRTIMSHTQRRYVDLPLSYGSQPSDINIPYSYQVLHPPCSPPLCRKTVHRLSATWVLRVVLNSLRKTARIASAFKLITLQLDDFRMGQAVIKLLEYRIFVDCMILRVTLSVLRFLSSVPVTALVWWFHLTPRHS